jgi:hypothetical protein
MWIVRKNRLDHRQTRKRKILLYETELQRTVLKRSFKNVSKRFNSLQNKWKKRTK